MRKGICCVLVILVMGSAASVRAQDFEELKPLVVYGEGFFGVEKSSAGTWRWLGDQLPKDTGPKVLKGLVLLLNSKKDTVLTIGAIIPLPMPAAPTVKFTFNGAPLDEFTEVKDRFEKSYKIPASKLGKEEYCELLITTNQFIIPAERSKTSRDDRRLGFRVTKLIWMEKNIDAQPPAPPPPQEAVPVTEIPPTPNRQTGWIALLAGAVVIFAAVFALALYQAFRSRRAGAAAADEPQADAEADSDAPIAFPCPGCGKMVRARPDLQGKKIKCPHCREVVLVTRRSASKS